MPREVFNEEWEFLPRDEMLTYEEIITLLDSFTKLGLKKIRLTGGEPLIRKDIQKLIELIKSSFPKIELALTTNGSLLKRHSKNLKNAGLDRITISLDAIDNDLFQSMNDTKIPVSNVLNGIDSAIESGFREIKINCVIKKGTNENQIFPLIEYFKNKNVILRFIEFMDVGNTNNWNLNQVMTKKEIVKKINSKYEFVHRGRNKKSDVAEQWIETQSSQIIEIISSISEPFCSNCTRARVSSDGKLYTCLFGFRGFDLKKVLREGGDLTYEIKRVWEERDDKFSEMRTEFITNPQKIEMSYIGG
tara:strand:+ start:1223 stop:2134 length:912 start_codon:yes stop_codon:yes gene_type:complete